MLVGGSKIFQFCFVNKDKGRGVKKKIKFTLNKVKNSCLVDQSFKPKLLHHIQPLQPPPCFLTCSDATIFNGCLLMPRLAATALKRKAGLDLFQFTNSSDTGAAEPLPHYLSTTRECLYPALPDRSTTTSTLVRTAENCSLVTGTFQHSEKDKRWHQGDMGDHSMWLHLGSQCFFNMTTLLSHWDMYMRGRKRHSLH